MGRKKARSKQEKATTRRKKRDRQNNQFDNSEDGDEAEMKVQLEKLGLALKEISGDGNCLFRALADQMYGHHKSVGGFHLKLRKEVVDFMRQHRDDFEPFVDEEVTFDRHLQLLEQDGTYAGQDAIVAFARLHQVTVVIHQLNEPLWQIHGSADGQTRCSRELHISYHNGDHYNSVRRIGDLESNEPANLKIDIIPTPNVYQSDSHTWEDDDQGGDLSDYENAPSRIEIDRRANEVRDLTGTTDIRSIYELLEKNNYNVHKSVAVIKQQKVSTGVAPSIWSEDGSGSRIFGSEVARAAASKVPSQKTNAKKAKGRKNQEKKLQQDEDAVITLVPTVETLSL